MGVRIATSAEDAVTNTDIDRGGRDGLIEPRGRAVGRPHIKGNPYYLDINSVSPGRKVETDAPCWTAPPAMSMWRSSPRSIRRSHKTPLLLAGRACARGRAASGRRTGDARRRSASDEVGAAAAIKMIRSVMIKGIEALTAGMLPGGAPRRHRRGGRGLAQEQLSGARLDRRWSAYNIERMASHGIRRAAEMEQSADHAARSLASSR